MAKKGYLFSQQVGFSRLSPGAQQLALVMDGNGNDLQEALKGHPALIEHLNEFSAFQIKTVHDIAHKSEVGFMKHTLRNSFKDLRLKW